MKNLDLNAYGVVEMNHQEMVETDGGLGFLVVLAVVAVAAVCSSCVNVENKTINNYGSGTVNNGNGTGNTANGNGSGNNSGNNSDTTSQK
jgi:hypothetical protein